VLEVVIDEEILPGPEQHIRLVELGGVAARAGFLDPGRMEDVLPGPVGEIEEDLRVRCEHDWILFVLASDTLAR
jgi:hypothetical protein